MSNFGSNIKHRRKALGVRQQDVAVASDVSIALISLLERGLAPTPATRKKVIRGISTLEKLKGHGT